MRYLVAGLGNPGGEYEGTRHNLGFDVVSKLAEKHRFSFQKERKVKGFLAKGEVEGRALFLLKPVTYMNESGVAVAAALRYFEIPLSHLLVVVDDVAIPLGQMRMREQGSFGGHNGLKSIEAHLGVNSFARLRIGVGKQQEGEDLADYVLGRFSQEEKEKLPEILEGAVRSIELWMEQGICRE